MTVSVTLPLLLDIKYRVLDNPPECRTYPVDIITAKHRGADVYPSLYVTEVKELQRIVWEKLNECG